MNKQELIEKVKELTIFSKQILNIKLVDQYDVIRLIKQLHEPQKVTIPQFVADWIEKAKKQGDSLRNAMLEIIIPSGTLKNWIRTRENGEYINQNTFALAWINGYTVEKEKRYIVKFKNVQSGSRYFKYDGVIGKWYFGINQDSNTTRLCHTKEELEEAGFGEVFNSPLFEVEEVME